jgi:hypothetical protein
MDSGADISRAARAEDEAGPAAAEEDAAWARLVAAWGDESAHRAYVAGLADLDALAAAGRRYRAVLAERPGDVVALRALGDIVRRATAQGLASLPRTAPPRRLSPTARRLLAVLLGLAFAAIALAMAVALHRHLGARS